MKRFAWLLLVLGCDDGSSAAQTQLTFVARHVQTLGFGAADNSEVIKLLPAGDKAVLVASKGRKVTLLGITADGMTELQSVSLFADDGGESELTHIDFDSAGKFAAITHTLPVVQDGAVVDCQGELVFVDVQPGATFGQVLNRVPVGPYPDAVDLNENSTFAVTADEVDFNDGKCPVASVVGSVTAIELPNGDPTQARVRARIIMDETADGGRREPEQIRFGFDDDRVAVTLQDTHEVLFFRLSDLLAGAGEEVVERPVADFTVTRYPNRDDGAEPWPDGVTRMRDANGAEWFVASGEYNDTFAFFTPDGAFEHQVAITAADVPSDFPRNIESWSLAPFRPDSVAAFTQGGRHYLAFSLKHAGAVGIWQAETPAEAHVAAVVKIGLTEMGTPTTESTVGPEGISAAEGIIVTANEKESSASLVRTELR